jgi:hypothetical protein
MRYKTAYRLKEKSEEVIAGKAGKREEVAIL